MTVLTTAAFTLGTGGGFPGVGQVAQGHRMYEIVLIQSSAAGDTVDLGFAELFTEIA